MKPGHKSFNGKRTKLSKIADIGKSYIYFYLPTKNRQVINYSASWNKIEKVAGRAYRVSAEASVALGACYVANGAAEAYVNLSNPSKWHDLAPAILIGKESGAIVDTKICPLLVAANKTIYNELVKIFT